MLAVELEKYTDTLLRNYVCYKGGPLIVFADKPTQDIGNAIIESASAMDTEIPQTAELVDVDKMRKGQPLTSLPDSFKQELDQKLNGPDGYHNTVLYIMHGLDGEGPMIKEIVGIASTHGKIGGLPGCTYDVLKAGFSPDNIPEFSRELYEFMLQENAVVVQCNQGTSLLIEMNHRTENNPIGYTLINSNGVLIPGNYGNPIPAEVFCHPMNVNGTLVISSYYNPLLESPKYKDSPQSLLDDLRRTPITLVIENGRVTDIHSEDRYIKGIVKHEIFKRDPEYGMMIGEFGLPANLHVLKRKPIGNTLIDEKGRVHLAHGHGYPNRTGCPYDSPVHEDGLLDSATLYSCRLGKDFMKDNVYSSSIFRTLRQ